ncbi:hypothetical protein CPB83DRAFT_795114 [Crepidotus variabilis]|uniref:Heat shock 70 kDa protein 12A n=1 Tax=Crepidotus variabilis TaxID=179855 RepID=A0A9P6EC36_9AGAR|nr:hypothetical protein CPB83DRAFT_795114 [Crepidotus variabilis]
MSGDGRTYPLGSTRSPYDGTRRKLVIAFDVGTTFSGISYCILDPGQIPSIKGVTRFPGQVATSGACKVPTIIFYDQLGSIRAVGAEATKDGIYELSQEENWAKAEWFKLHLRSKFGDDKNLTEAIPPLPPNKTVVEVIADFLAYLLECTATYIQDTHPNGRVLWDAFLAATMTPTNASNHGMFFVLSHPNGWEGKEQAQMRKAVVQARLIPDTPEGRQRIKFVTEGEASLHFVVQNNLISHIKRNEGIVVVDAGGGTVDVSAYKRQHEQGAQAFEEISEARCYFHGSVFVTIAARNFLTQTLAESEFLDDLENIVSCFDQTTKLRFSDDKSPQYIRFGSRKDNDANVGIRFGQMKLEGSDLADLFRPSIDCIVQAVMNQKQNSSHNIQHVILVGGFSGSDWLFHRVQDTLTNRGMTVIRPENNVVKAVSDGAISFYIDHYVHARVAKISYGVVGFVTYDKNNPEHRKRSHRQQSDADGISVISDAFKALLKKGTQIKESQEFSIPLFKVSHQPTDHYNIKQLIISYRGHNTNPEWIDVDTNNFTDVFTLHADLSHVPRISQINAAGKEYYTVKWDVVILFGLTEFKAQVRWFENGIEKRSAATLIYD